MATHDSPASIEAADLADWLADDLDVPVEIDWATHAIGLLVRAHPGQLDMISVGHRQPAPGAKVNFLRLRTHAPALAALLFWQGYSPRAPLATSLTVAMAAHAAQHLHLYRSANPAISEHLRQAGLGLRKLCKVGGSAAPDHGNEADAITRGVHALQQWLLAPGIELNNATHAQLLRLVSWLQLIAPPVVPKLQPVDARLREFTRERLPTAQTAADDEFDARWQAALPVERAVARDPDGEVDPDKLVARVALTLPGADRVIHRGMRMAMSALQVRAASSAAGVGRVARLGALTDGVLEELGSAMAGASTPVAAQVLVAGALYAGLSPAHFARLPVVDRIDGLSSTQWALLRRPLALVVPARAAARAPSPREDYAVNCLAPGAHAVLPLSSHVPFAEVITRWVAARGEGETVASAVDWRIARDWLQAYARAASSPVTARRLATVLPEGCRATGVGMAELALLTGRAGGNANASNAYYAAEPPAIVRVHAPAISWIAERLGGERHIPHPPSAGGQAVGSRRVPKAAAVTHYMSALRAVDLQRPARRPTLAEQRSYHLRLQALVAEIALWCTGARPFARALDGLLDADDFIIIDEKARPGGAGRSHARIVPVCSVLASTLAAWRAHRDAVAARCGMAVITERWFEITAERGVRPLPWRRVREPLPASGLAWNASRNWFRSRLSAMGIVGPVIDAWMGHALLGAEPGMPLCTRAPAHIDLCAFGLLEQMTRELRLPDLGGRG